MTKAACFWLFLDRKWKIILIKNDFKILEVHLMVFMSCSLDNFEHSNFRAWNWISTERGQVNKIIYKLIFEFVHWSKRSKKCHEYRLGKHINFMGGIAKLPDRFSLRLFEWIFIWMKNWGDNCWVFETRVLLNKHVVEAGLILALLVFRSKGGFENSNNSGSSFGFYLVFKRDL